jgi:hypothetical protein
MNCPKCGVENRDNASFCNNCGAPIVPIPAKSTTPLESGGTPVPPEKKLGPLFWWGVVFLILFSILVTILFWNVPPPNPNKYCSGTYPGTVYNSKTNECDHTPTPTPTVSWTPYPRITYTVKTTDEIRVGKYIKVEYSGEWLGAITTQHSSKTVDGYGTESFDIGFSDSIGSGCFSKKDNSYKSLSVRGYKDGKIIAIDSTSSPFGVVCISI